VTPFPLSLLTFDAVVAGRAARLADGLLALGPGTRPEMASALRRTFDLDAAAVFRRAWPGTAHGVRGTAGGLAGSAAGPVVAAVSW
jgi:hypothetical protein